MTSEHAIKYLRSTMELEIERSVQDAFDDWPTIRDETYGHNSDDFRKKVAAIILTGLYVDYGCDIENLASEFLMLDFRKRDTGNYPELYCATIANLYDQYKILVTSPSSEGEFFRSKKRSIERRIKKKLEFIDKTLTL